ncbi:MAG: hypothetical protein LBL96_05520 [Clostridiales bacterium]|nr:hypothetical protein [Clostridiales bacterium]
MFSADLAWDATTNTAYLTGKESGLNGTPTVAPTKTTPTPEIRGADTYTVVPGGNAVVTIQGTPGVEYSIKYITPKGNVSTAQGLTKKTADSKGNVLWEWEIGPGTSSGTGSVTITGSDGSVLHLSLEIQ